MEKLLEDYGLSVAKTVDLRGAAKEAYGLVNPGLKELARVVLGEEIEKPRRVTMSRWDNRWLTAQQVQYACLDAYLSFAIANTLNVCGFNNQ